MSVVDSILEPLAKAVKKAEKHAHTRADHEEVRNLRRRLALAKMVVQENARQANPRPSRYGPGSTELFSNVGLLPPDSQMGGV